VLGILIITAGILAVTYDRDTDVSDHRFDVACHTPGEVPQECDEVFTSVPLCAFEDCSDQWPKAGYFIDPSTGVMQYEIPDTPLIIADQS
jgi:hypothetical protein